MELSADEYLQTLKSKLLHPTNWQPITPTRAWAYQAPSEAGIYVLKENDKLIYVGETGNLKGRMLDLLDSRQHSMRRTLGASLFNQRSEYVEATASKKFPELFELELNDYYTNKLLIAYLTVPLGRKELEEYLIYHKQAGEFWLNKRSKR